MANLTRRLKRPIVVVVVVLAGGMPFSLPMTSATTNTNTSANTSANTSSFQTPRHRHLQGISIGSGTSLTTCSANLLVSDTNPRDESLSQSEFVDFVQRTLLESVHDPTCSDGTGGCSLYLDRREDDDEDEGVLMNGLYQIPISSFHLLPPDLVGVFNRIACGNANYGCLNGIDISGVVREENGEGGLTDQEQAVLFRLCSDVEDAVGELAEAMPTTWATTTSSAGTTSSTGTTSSALPVCPLDGYVAGTAYAAGDRVVVVVEAEEESELESESRSYYSYRCRDFPYTAWCSQEAYAPGKGGNWNMAWVPLGECDGGGDVDVTTATATATATAMATSMATSSASTTTTTSTDVTWTGSTFGAMERTTTATTTTNVATTSSSSSSSSTTTTTTTNPDDPPYTGNVPVRFHYRIANTVGFAAASVPESIEAALLKETTDLVEEVIVDTFGGADDGGGDDGGDGDVFAAMEVDVDEYEYDNDNGHGGTKRAHLRGIPHDDGGIRRRLQGPSSPNENNHDRHRHRRQLQVVYEPGSVAIVDFEDVDCPVADDTNEEVVLLCQRVHCAVDLILFDEPKHATELQFQKNLSRAIADGAIQLPPEMGVTATSLDSAVVVVPDAVDDNNNNNNNNNDNNNNDNNNDNNNNNNRWQLPVIVTCAVAAVLVAL
ncbi:hypothetical protein ACHAXS_013854, partial [Conticribra weissflogii]